MDEGRDLHAEVTSIEEILHDLKAAARNECVSFSDANNHQKYNAKLALPKKRTNPSSSRRKTNEYLEERSSEPKGKNNSSQATVLDGALSTVTRVRGFRMNTSAARKLNQEIKMNISIPLGPECDDDDEYIYEEVELTRTSLAPGQSSSNGLQQTFSKAVRFPLQNQSEDTDFHPDHKHVTSSSNVSPLRGRVHSFGKEKRPLTPSDSKPREDVNYEMISNKELESLSGRFRSPAVTFHTTSTARRIIPGKEDISPSLGPGYYSISEDAYKRIKSQDRACSPAVGVIYRSPSTPRNMKYRSQKDSERLRQQLLGPGTYNVSESINFVKTSAPAITLYKPDCKPTKQLEKKHYWEQKAADLRDIHDDMRDANDSFLLPRTPTIEMAPKKYGLSSTTSHSEIHSSNLGYDVKHDFVERRVTVGVTMKSEILARESTQRMVNAKPGVVKALADKATATAAHQKLYGPNLPVQWVEDRKGMQTWQRGGEESDGSPTREVLKLLHGFDGPDRTRAAAEEEEEATAKAFLRSSFSGSLMKKPVAVMKQEPSHRPFVIDMHEEAPSHAFVEHDQFESPYYKHMTLRMDLGTGRDTLRVHKKGLQEMIEFSDHRIKKDLDLPPEYDLEPHFAISALNNVKGVPFAKAIAREDMVGANGERPASSLVPLHEQLQDDDYFEARLDIDRADAIDKAEGPARGIELYASVRPRHAVSSSVPSLSFFREQERYPISSEVVDGPRADHIGGIWFKGMYEELASKNAVVKYDRMSGREEEAVKDVYESNGLMDEYGQQGAVLDLEEVDRTALKPKTPSFVMQDPKKYPRFPEPVNNGAKETDNASIPYSFVEVPEKAKVFVNMDLMRGREDDQAADLEREVARRDVEGDITALERVMFAEQRAKAVLSGQDLTSKHKKVSESIVDMSKQLGREDDSSKKPDDEDHFDIPASPSRIPPTNPRLPGVMDWSKMSGREAPVDLTEEIFMHQQEQGLELNPSSHASSR